MSAVTYIEFLKERHELDFYLLNIPADVRELLEIIAVHAAQGKPMTVTQFMGLTHLASPATLHRKLSDLLDKLMVVLVHEGKDRRTKFIHPSGFAIDYFARAGAALEKARAA